MDRKIKDSDIFVGKFFTEKRIEHRYTQEQVCDILSINRSTFCRYERGSRGIPFSVMKKLCKLYHLDFYDTIVYLDKELEKQGLIMYE